MSNTPNSLEESIFDKLSLGNYNAPDSFLQSNSLVARFAFLLLVAFVFILLLRLFSSYINYYITHANTNPTKVIDGMIDASSQYTFEQDPSNKNSMTIYRSSNEDEGVEFTWSVYLFINDTLDNQISHIFSKGSPPPSNGYATMNAPGLYMDTTSNANNLVVSMDSFSIPSEKISISNIPRNKWINVIIRCKNTTVDVYMNGLIAQSFQLSGVPKQNYASVFVAYNHGLSNSKLSNLFYYNYALSIGEIQRISYQGPSLNMAKNSGGAESTKPPADYLSLRWYVSGQ